MEAHSVCSHWREVAVSTPSLWTRINIDFCSFVRSLACSPKGGKCHRKNRRMIESLRAQYASIVPVFMDRSRNLPLTIIFWSSPCQAKFSALIDGLLAHSARWKSLTLRGSYISQLLLAIHQGLPLLETLDYNESEARGTTSGYDFHCVGVGGAPHLQSHKSLVPSDPSTTSQSGCHLSRLSLDSPIPSS